MARPKSKAPLTTFKAIYSNTQYFRFGDIESESETYVSEGGFFSTEDKDIIEYLRNNTSWQEVKEEVQGLPPIG